MRRDWSKSTKLWILDLHVKRLRLLMVKQFLFVLIKFTCDFESY